MSCQHPLDAENLDERLDDYLMERPRLLLTALDLMEKFERGGKIATEEPHHAS